MVCPYCGEVISNDKKFCGKCGKSLRPARSDTGVAASALSRCITCGALINPGKKFCGACGSPVVSRSAEQITERNLQQSTEQHAQQHTQPVRTPIQPPSISRSTEVFDHPPATFPSTAAKFPSASSYPSPASSYEPISRQPFRGPSKKVIGSIALSAIVILALLFWYRLGVQVDLTTVPGGASVVLDGIPIARTNYQTGALSLPHLHHGSHSLTITHFGFDDYAENLQLGWFELHHAEKILLPIPSFALTIQTNPPGAKISVDRLDNGVSDSTGNVTLKLSRGQHSVSVSADGYPAWSHVVWIQGPLSLRADLAAAAAAAQQEAALHASRAQSFYQQRQYQAALGECDAALKLDPTNQSATALRSQIQQTISILGAQ